MDKTMGDRKIAQALRKVAQGLESTIQKKLHPAVAEQNFTHRRARQIASMRDDALYLQRIQQVANSLAEMHEKDAIPFEVWGIRSKKTILSIIHEDVYPCPREGAHAWRLEKLKATEVDFRKAGITPLDYEKVRTIILGLAELAPEVKSQREKMDRETQIRGMVGKVPGYFPTPQPVINLMLTAVGGIPAGNHAGFMILEPSAGDGAIARAIREKWEKATLHCIEINYTLRHYLEDQGFNVVQEDFLAAPLDEMYDLIFMNPPFEKGQDMVHVRKAYSCLKVGGDLVSIMSPSPFTVKTSKAEEFRQWFEGVGGYKDELPAGSFEKSGTGVNACVVQIHKNS